MPTSLRGRRFKPLLTMAVLAVLTILYLTSSARTSSSDFYTRTEDALAHQKQQEAERAAEDVNVGAGGALGVSGGTGSEVDVRKQLREAEERAKASADRKGEMERARLGMEALPDPQENAAAKDNEDVGNSNSAASAGKKTVPVREGVALDADDDDLWPVESDPELSDHEIVSPGEKNQVPVKTSGKEQTAETEEEHKVEQELNSILKRSPIIIFSKTYCRFSKKAKHILLDLYKITPVPYVVELDEHPLGGELQNALGDSTGRRTVPNVLINGKSIGGGDDVEALHMKGELASTVKSMGGKRIMEASVVQGAASGDSSRPRRARR